MLLWALPSLACEPEELAPQTFQPAQDAVDIPLDVRVAVRFVGWGTADEYTVTLAVDGAEIATDLTTYCYAHEGPSEVHCGHLLRTRAPLAPSTSHTIHVASTATHVGSPMVMQSRFTTGTALAEPVTGTPEFAVTDAWDEAAANDCQWDVARRYWLQILPAGGAIDPTALSLFHISSVDEAGVASDTIHTIFVTNPGATGVSNEPIKQYLDGSVMNTDCFQIVQEDPAGRWSAPVRDCWEPPGDSGDTATEDSGAPDTPTGDSAPEDTSTGDGAASDTSAPDAEPSGKCACGGGGASALVALPVLAALSGRRRRLEVARRSEAPPSTSTQTVLPG